MGCVGITEIFPTFHSAGHTTHRVWDLEAQRMGPGFWWVGQSALCPLRTTAAVQVEAVAAGTPEHQSWARFFLSSCSFSNSSSSFSSQGAPVHPAGRAGLPVRQPQGHPQEFQAGETPPRPFPLGQPWPGFKDRLSPTPLPASWG